MDTKDMYDIRLALNYAIEPEAPKAQAPSSTCPFIIINYVKERFADKLKRTLIHPDLHQGMKARICRQPPANRPKGRPHR
jgi:hypothetical protein